MGIWEYDWEPFEIVTNDGYTLTLMHVTKKSGPFHSGPNKDMAPIVVMPPMGSSPHSWLEAYLYPSPPDNPMLFKLRDAGHDLWFTYSRGTDYSLKHESYAPDSKEFWDFSWEQMGTGDLRAAVDYVHAATSQKVGLLGYSMGTTQIFAAMSLEYDSFFKDRVYKVAQLAPCTITEPSQYKGFNMATVNLVKTMGIFEIGGPTWYTTVVKIRKIIGLEGLQGFLAIGWGSRLKDISIKAFLHYAENSKQDRFQRYSESYWQPLGKKETELYDLSLIKADTPFGFFFGDKDVTCENKYAEAARTEMGDTVQAYHAYEGLDHTTMIFFNTDEFVQDILTFLKPSQQTTAVADMLLQ